MKKSWIIIAAITVLTALLALCCCLLVIAAPRAPALLATPIPRQPVEYLLTHRVSIRNEGPGNATLIQFREALPRDLAPYQSVIAIETDPPDHQISSDSLGNRYAEFEFHNLAAGQQIVIEIRSRVIVYPLDHNLDGCEGPQQSEHRDPERYIESDAKKIRTLAASLAQDKTSDCEKVRSFYDYTIQTLSYQFEQEKKGALATLADLKGDCDSYSNLLIALSRASDIAARSILGVAYSTDDSGNVIDDLVAHHWVEVYFPGSGWLPVDPTWGATTGRPDDYFARLTPTHILLTVGDNLSALDGLDIFLFRYWYDRQGTQISFSDRWTMEIAP